ncbi:hypothetical protein [Synechococcus phage BUCT-ZZ01]|nr:hypothetical protein [Synechococcus phage BUCT-ZZ01]
MNKEVDSKSAEISIILLKLVTGEEVIATVEDHGNMYFLTDALQIIPTMNEKGGMHLNVMQFMPYLEDGIPVSKASVVLFGVPKKNLMDQYKEYFGKILTPPKSSIIV